MAISNIDCVVVGLCSHGLAVTRSLNRSGGNVIAIESNRSLPAVKTNSAKVVFVESIASDGLLDALNRLAVEQSFANSKPWLFLTNDAMVRVVSSNWKALSDKYQISWAGSRDTVHELLGKSSIPAYCEAAGVDYPKTFDICISADCQSLPEVGKLVIKPAEPMGEFKVIFADSRGEVERVVADYPESLPLVAQEWIAGSAEQLVFASGFAVDGVFKAVFSGYKVRSWPLDSGQGSVIAPGYDETIIKAAQQFVLPTRFTGPIAIEFKRRPDGSLALIEPNLGRTEYCVKLAEVNGVDLVAAEYEFCCGQEVSSRSQSDRVVWCDFERDFRSIFVGLGHLVSAKGLVRISSPFASVRDPLPFMYATVKRIVSFVSRAGKKALLLRSSAKKD